MREKQRRQDRCRGLDRWLVTLVATVFMVLGAGSVSAGGRCVTVDVPAPFRMPDGAVHPAGSLRLCDSRSLSPVAGLHKVYVDGHLINTVQSRLGRSEGPAESEPFVQFRRNGDQQLELLGYAWPDGRKMKTYVMVRDDARDPDSRTRRSSPTIVTNGERQAREERIILVAGRGN